MNVSTIKISLVILLIAGCSPDHKKNNIDLNELSEIKTIDESALEKEWQAIIELREKNLQSVVENQAFDNEKTLLEDADNLQNRTEEQLLKVQVREKLLAEEALLESIKSRAADLVTQ
ncbi:hypothetical protein H4J38_02975 [Colwellia sp. BRX10-3]|uniref:hypothetical protein n=1 Tax=Colwellia sp. BRX10-3 TaxID=2759844 RepID=UPI0015F7314A|nr:hypothetical protein [Colwellia sp. BRX10-3]MBA6389737.1 hypothetical protein [Colwellia sp. BRX10-3]